MLLTPAFCASARTLLVMAGGVRKLRAVDDGSESWDTDGTVWYEAFEAEESLMVGVLGLMGVTGRECMWYHARTWDLLAFWNLVLDIGMVREDEYVSTRQSLCSA